MYCRLIKPILNCHVLHRLYKLGKPKIAMQCKDWDAFYKAGRDTAEALAETKQMGYSLVRLLNDIKELPEDLLFSVKALKEPAFPTIYATVAQTWQIPAQDMLQGYAWGWLENQASASMKSVPLGQVAGQKILLTLGETLPSVVAHAMLLQDDEISNFNPLLSIAGCLHETQYSRLFRS
jgi:urease accessory protein